MNLSVSIHDILKQPGITERFEYKGPIDLVQVDLAGDIEVDLKLTNVLSRILVAGRIKADLELVCARCLEPYVEKLDIEVQEEFLPSGSPELNEEKMDWDSLSKFSFEDEEIDLYEPIRQNIIGAIPVKPLCREDCEGIPGPWNEPDSGEEFGFKEGTSQNVNNNIDPRLLPLKDLKSKAEN